MALNNALMKIGGEIAKRTAKDVGSSTLSNLATKAVANTASKSIPVLAIASANNTKIPVKVDSLIPKTIREELGGLGMTQNDAGKWIMNTAGWDTNGTDGLKKLMSPLLCKTLTISKNWTGLQRSLLRR